MTDVNNCRVSGRRTLQSSTALCALYFLAVGCGAPAPAHCDDTPAESTRRLVYIASVSPDVAATRWIINVAHFGTRRLWLFDAKTGSCTRLPGRPSLSLTPWRPGRDEIAFANGDWQIEVLNVKTRESRVVPFPPAAEEMCTWPQWSPDGRLLAFYGYVNTESDRWSALFTVDPEGASPPKLEALGVGGSFGWRWMPGSDAIVYVSRPDSPPRPPDSIAVPLKPEWSGSATLRGWNSDGTLLACDVLESSRPDRSAQHGWTVESRTVVLDRTLEHEVYRSPFLLQPSIFVWNPRGNTLLVSRRGTNETRPMAATVDVNSGEVVDLPQEELAGAEPVAWVVGHDGEERMFFLADDRTALLMTEGPDAPVISVVTIDERGVPTASPLGGDEGH